MRKRVGFTLVEVALAVAVGITIMAVSVYTYQQVQTGAKFSSTKEMVGTIQVNIGMDKFRKGTPPSVTSLISNVDSAGKPFYPGTTGALPPDPITTQNGVLLFDSTQTPAPIAAGDPTPAWDNPIFQAGAPTPAPPAGYTAPTGLAYGKGGWLYDPNTGAFRANLNNKDYPDQRPGSW